MGSRYLTDLGDVLRRAGLDVIELDGWQTRARGSGGYDSGRPSVVMVHHTASPASSSGEGDALYSALYDEDAPLSNLCLDRDGIWWILATGATNTNGAGGPLAGVPEDSMNSHAIGVEANGGYGDAWPAVQTNSYVAGVAALCQAYGIGEVFAHFEWAPSRKIDPAGPSPWATGGASWNMDRFRADVDAGASSPAPEPGPEPGPEPAPKPPAPNEGDDWMADLPTIAKGSSGVYVERMQHLLAAAGYMNPANTANYDGAWGDGTDGAKAKFDKDHGLSPSPPTDCGPKSWESLLTGRKW